MQAYLSRIEKALHYIESNLERRFGVADVAAVAGYSPYHFHRLFTLIVGES
ncbi:MAG: AraC family transcriptional regulator, partial [Planctomycetota bacterium]|nr:AraC family transcriptional regulator [Planctomycetota bacterium]